jgi:ADP-heptose:LPS heptosyltransferase
MNLKTLKIIDYYLGNFLIVCLKPLVILLGILLRREHDLRPKNNITILKLLGGGSLVIAFPAILGLRRKYPELRLNLVTTKAVTPFARSLNVFDNILEIDSSSVFRFLQSSVNTYLKTFRRDTIVDLEVYSRLSTVFSLLTCSRNRIGFYLQEAFWRKRLHTHLLYFNPFCGSFEFYDKVFRLFDAFPSSADECKEHIIKHLPRTAKPEKYRISVGHACSDLALERMLNVNQWEIVFKSRLDESVNAEIVFLGTEKDSELALKISERLSHHLSNISCINLCGKASLSESLSVLSLGDEFWGIDSSLIHYARLFRIKSVSFWGPTDPNTLLRDIPGLQEENIYCKIPCSPCIHITESPPCKGDNICIQNLFSDKKREWIGLVT